MQAEHELEAAADLPADQHAGERVLLQTVPPCASYAAANCGAAREIERDRAGIGFVGERRRDRLEHDRVADAIGGAQRSAGDVTSASAGAAIP